MTEGQITSRQLADAINNPDISLSQALDKAAVAATQWNFNGLGKMKLENLVRRLKIVASCGDIVFAHRIAQ